MKSYRKQNAPDVLRDWNRSNRAWENFVADPIAYSQVKQSLLGEQNHLCCYCESDIEDSGSHIEHYEPGHVRRTEFTNMTIWPAHAMDLSIAIGIAAIEKAALMTIGCS